MTVRSDFAVFLLSHGRPEFLAENTLANLLESGYSGRWYVLLSSDDPTIEEYRSMFGAERILVFEKREDRADLADAGGSKGVVVYARNAAVDAARDLGLTYLLELDDDYTYFRYRWPDLLENRMHSATTTRIDEIFEAMLDFLDDSGAAIVALAQGGDYMGGRDNSVVRDRLWRKAMNALFMRVDRAPTFVGRINEDVNTYVSRGAVGDLFLTVSDFALNQAPTQSTGGGMSAAYSALGTYVKSFYTVLYAPSAVKVSAMGRVFYRLHHLVDWNSAVPKVVSGRYRRPLPDELGEVGATVGSDPHDPDSSPGGDALLGLGESRLG